jgi:hypothetical protein
MRNSGELANSLQKLRIRLSDGPAAAAFGLDLAVFGSR